MSLRRHLLIALALSTALLGGCSKKKGESKLAKLCVEASEQLTSSASEDGETFKMQLSNAMQACSGGCDDGDDASCKSLESHINKICGVSPSVCESLCGSVKSPSLKKTSCEFKKS